MNLLGSFGSAREEELECGVSLDTVVSADLFVLGAVDRDDLCLPLGVRVDFFGELTPCRRKVLAVAAPWGVEFHEERTGRMLKTTT